MGRTIKMNERKGKEINECNVHGSTHTERWFIHIGYSLIFDFIDVLMYDAVYYSLTYSVHSSY